MSIRIDSKLTSLYFDTKASHCKIIQFSLWIEYTTIYDLFITELQASVLTEFGQTVSYLFIHIVKRRHNEEDINYRRSKQFIYVHMPNLPSKFEGIAWCIAFLLEAVYIVLGNFLTLVLFAVNKRIRKRSLFLVINININYFFVQSMNAAEYLRIDPAYVIIPFITLPPLSFDFNSFLKRWKYSFVSLVFISSYITLSASRIPKYL